MPINNSVIEAMEAAGEPVTVIQLADTLDRGVVWVRQQLRLLDKLDRLDRVEVTRPTLSRRPMTTPAYLLKPPKKGEN